jgi:hypothetical protein
MAGIYGAEHTRSTGGQYIDIREDLSGAIRYAGLGDTPFYAMLPRIEVQPTHIWITDALKSLSGTMGAHIHGSAGALTLTATSGTCTRFNIGDVLRIDSEFLRISAVASTALTVTRGYGSTTRDTHTATSITIMGNAWTESASISAYATTYTRCTNQCQIFHKAVEVSGTRRAVAAVGGDEWGKQTYKRGLEHIREIERELFHGKIQLATANTTARHLRGIVDAISTTRRTTSNTLLVSRCNEFFKCIYDAGGSPNVAVVDSVMIQAIHQQNLGYVQVDSFDLGLGSLGGVRAQRWVSPWGDMALLPVRTLGGPIGQTGCLLALTWDEVKLGVLPSRELLFEMLGKTGDKDSAMLTSELTIEWGNEAYHGYMGRKSARVI